MWLLEAGVYDNNCPCQRRWVLLKSKGDYAHILTTPYTTSFYCYAWCHGMVQYNADKRGYVIFPLAQD
jgi:hypothetical protein